jgi:mRNA interferase MazF
MPTYRFGDVVLIPFPFTDQSGARQRPAVVVSAAAYHQARHDLILMPISAQLGGGPFGEVPVKNWQAVGLLKPSIIKPVFAHG